MFALISLELKKAYIISHFCGLKMEEESQIREGKYAADICSIKEAETRIRSFIHKTPVLSSGSLDTLSGRRLFFKCELFQKG